METSPMEKHISLIKEHAEAMGVSEFKVVDPAIIPVDEKFRKLCKNCPSYGQSMSCPPHGESPDRFREHLGTSDFALFFNFEVPTPVLLSDERDQVSRLIHETAAGLEIFANSLDFPWVRGYAGGGCKMLFCSDHPECRVLSGDGKCRHPDKARQSLSCVGVDFMELCRRLSWKMSRGLGEEKTGIMIGMVLIKN